MVTWTLRGRMLLTGGVAWSDVVRFEGLSRDQWEHCLKDGGKSAFRLPFAKTLAHKRVVSARVMLLKGVAVGQTGPAVEWTRRVKVETS